MMSMLREFMASGAHYDKELRDQFPCSEARRHPATLTTRLGQELQGAAGMSRKLRRLGAGLKRPVKTKIRRRHPVRLRASHRETKLLSYRSLVLRIAWMSKNMRAATAIQLKRLPPLPCPTWAPHSFGAASAASSRPLQRTGPLCFDT